MPKRLDEGRREELLDGIMRIIVARGFADVRVQEMAAKLHCSVASLYKIAPSKDSLVLLAIARWSELSLAELEKRAAAGTDLAERARIYFRAGAQALEPMTESFRSDVDRFESTRMTWRATVDRFISRFAELLDQAIDAGEARAVNTRLVARVLHQISAVTRDPRALAELGLTPTQALLEVDALIWDGLKVR